MGKKFDKFLLLMWKNLLLLKRNPKQTAIEVLAPVLFSSFLIIIRSLIVTESYGAVFYKPFKTSIPIIKKQPILQFVTWSPENPILENIVQDALKQINLEENILIHPVSFKNSTAMVEYLSDVALQQTLAAIQFEDNLFSITTLPSTINITLRFPGELRRGKYAAAAYGQYIWNTNLLFPTYQVAGPRGRDMNEGAEPGYDYEGFLKLQQELSLSIIKHHKQATRNETFDLPMKLKLQRFPYPKWTQDLLLKTLEVFVSLIVMLSFVYSCINIVKAVTAEKEHQLKEAMKIMGLPSWLHWTAWFIKSFVVLLIAVILIVVLTTTKWYKGSSVFTYTSPTVLFVFLMFYVSATITFSFLISTLFSKANTAATIAGLLWFLSYFPFSLSNKNYANLTLSVKLLASFCSNSAMAHGFQLTVMFEGVGEGLQWSNVWKSPNPDDSLKLGYILIMLAVDTILYLLTAIYIENVFPGEYGVPQVWYFPFSSFYWFGGHQENQDAIFNDASTSQNEFIENEPLHLPVGISIVRLRKEFSDKVAVRKLTLNMYKNQITVLLGQNGAGKTTTMSMLTGMIRPTSGTAIINDHNINTDITEVRRSLGLCPQHNILFDQLTVREHLYFYTRLKGLDKYQVEQEIEKYLDLLDLQSKADSRSETLSGGMKRKLSVGIALCGGSKVIFLDEPTAGMDPAARRTLWNLLKSQKNDRTVLLTTHFMDEADLLGDRIAIMANGQLICCGSSFFLKKKYAAGYNLVMEKSSKCHVGKITEVLQKHLPDIRVESDIGSELTYVLTDEQLPVFEEMLKELEDNSEGLGIESYGISLTTLGEVFMKVSNQETEETMSLPTSQTEHFTHRFRDAEISNPQFDYGNAHLATGFSLWRKQFLAMMLKRCCTGWRTWYLILIMILICVVFLILGIIIGRSNKLQNLPKLLIQLRSYDEPVTVLTYDSSNKYSSAYMNILKKDKQIYIDWNGEDLSKNMFKKTINETALVRMRYICGASFIKNELTAWFNNEPYHSPPLCFNLILNAILQQEVSPEYRINIYNHPLPFTSVTQVTDLTREHNMSFQIAFNIGFSMAFASSFYIIFYVKERVSKAKHLQFVSGVNVLIFWATSFLYDLLTFLFLILCMIVTLVAFQEDGFSTLEELSRVFCILFCFGFSILPAVYLNSYFTNSASTAYTRMTLINILAGIGPFILVQILSAPELFLKNTVDVLHWLFLIIPHYMLCSGIKDIYTLYSIKNICWKLMKDCLQLDIPSQICRTKVKNKLPECFAMEVDYFDLKQPGIGRNILFSTSLALVLILLLLIIEFGFMDKLIYKLTKKHSAPPTTNLPQDSDVQIENEEIRNASMSEIKQNDLVLRDVTKYYNDFLAVNSMCLRVNRYECFGLLGVNGAGKTTTFKMMTGDINFSYGDAWIKGINLKTERKKVNRLTGYCPQFDAFLEDLTVRETLVIFGLIRGSTRENCNTVAQQLATEFDFQKYLDKKVNTLSGGNKRKISTALALIGDPLVIFLDEPTTGMDTVTKRYLWKALCKIRDRGKCIILTTHSMEECEALCTRLAIMVNGTFMCLGSTQRLKSKFSEGYTLTIKTTKAEYLEMHKQNAIRQFVDHNFPSAVIREEHEELITFYIPDKTLSWSKMFGIMERGKKSLPIEDYSLGQSTLEQIFLSFTKYQKEEQ